MTNKKAKLTVLITLAALITAVIVVYFTIAPDTDLDEALVINTHGQPTMGIKNAKIHIVAFEDLKCGNCALFNKSIFPKIKQKYIDTGIAKYTFFNVAFVPGSLPAANAARCLYEQHRDYFFDFVDYLYQHQPPENQDWATTAKLMEFAKAATPKANLTQFSHCSIEGKYNNVLANNLIYANDLTDDELATPTIYINGYQLRSFSMNAVDQLVTNIRNTKKGH